MDANQIQSMVQAFSWRDIVQLLVIFSIGFILIRLLTRLLDRLMDKLKVAQSIHAMLKTISVFALWGILIMIVVTNLGVNLNGLVAVLSVLTLAVSLAVQGTLSNLAGGVQVVAAHPFMVGDYVQIGEHAGTVTELGLTYTRLQTYDGRLINIPNSHTATSDVINFRMHGLRRQDVVVGLSYNAPLKEAESALKAVIQKVPGIQLNPPPEVLISEYKDSCIEYTLRL